MRANNPKSFHRIKPQRISDSLCTLSTLLITMDFYLRALHTSVSGLLGDRSGFDDSEAIVNAGLFEYY
jgi:hypothetical protein